MRIKNQVYPTAEQVGAAAATHASQHASGGSDPITPADIGALPLSGGTITGALKVTGEIKMPDSRVTKGTNPTAGQYKSVKFLDSNNENLSLLQSSVSSAGVVALSMHAYKNEADSTDTATLKVVYDTANNNCFALAPDGNLGTNALRNIRASANDLTAGTSTLITGQIYLVYE